MMRCDRCGHEVEGAYCARCGAPMSGPKSEADDDMRPKCPECDAPVGAEDLYCSECGAPVRSRPEKSASAYTPWILSALALIAFAVGITLLVRAESSPRSPDQPVTGGVISGGGGRMEGAGPAGGATGDPGDGTTGAPEGAAPRAPAAGASESGMPSAEELARMPPREAADRLFNRAMTLWSEARPGAGARDEAPGAGDAGGVDPGSVSAADPAGGLAERARFFAQMGVRAYRRVPAAEADADLRFHVGLLQLVRGETASARAEADTILAAEEGNLLGLLLAARAAEARGDSAAAVRLRVRLREGVRRTDLDARPDYEAHRALLETAADGQE